ncbi:MAG: hypothetical protein OEW11_00770 [Nitrospirota bacterium]|nr:hypothetical protein [Nitrospirota bacterium]
MFDETGTTWEYRVEQLSAVQLTNQLNFLGKEGWALVSVLHHTGEEHPYECFFQRPRGARY